MTYFLLQYASLDVKVKHSVRYAVLNRTGSLQKANKQ